MKSVQCTGSAAAQLGRDLPDYSLNPDTPRRCLPLLSGEPRLLLLLSQEVVVNVAVGRDERHVFICTGAVGEVQELPQAAPY